MNTEEPRMTEHQSDGHAVRPPSFPIVAELREVNEHLLLAGLREQELAEQLSRQLSFTNAVTDALGEGICALDRECRITFANPAAAHLLELTETELLGRDLHDVVHYHDTTSCQLRDMFRAGTIHRQDDVFLRRDGTAYPVEYSVTPIITDGWADGTVVAFRDITTRKRLEETQANLLAHEQTARSAAEISLQVRSNVLAAVSHDLRQPLTVINGTAQILSRQIANLQIAERDQLLDRLERIDSSTATMTGIINELLDVAQLTAGQRLTLDLHPTDLVALLGQIVINHDRLTEQSMMFDTEEESLVGSWDAARLERVIVNLLSNAKKYSPHDRTIILRLARKRGVTDWAVIEIQDEGIGIPADDLPHIFDRFYRASNATDAAAGTGLGLSGAKAIIELHGGRLELVSAEGMGTTVTVHLPVVAPLPVPSKHDIIYP
jgi:PAS domain S-box-containing protein